MVGDERMSGDNRLGVGDKPGLPYISKSTPRGINPEAIPERGDSTMTCLVNEPFPFEPIPEETAYNAKRKPRSALLLVPL